MRELWARIQADFRSNPGVWIGVAVSAAVLMLAYLAYRHSQASASPTTAGLPNWAGAQSGDAPGAAPTNQELQNEFNALAAFLQNRQTPNPPTTAAPSGSSAGSTVSSNPARAVTTAITSSVTRVASAIKTATTTTTTRTGTVAGAIQNPTSLSTAFHSGQLSGAIQNPTSAQTTQHRGTASVTYPATSVQLAPVHHTVTTTGHGYTI